MIVEKKFENRFLLLQKDLSNSAFGRRCGISEATVRYCRRGQIPSQKLLKKIAEANNVTVGWLLGITDEGGPRHPGNVAFSSGQPVKAQKLSLLTDKDLKVRNYGRAENVNVAHGDFTGNMIAGVGLREQGSRLAVLHAIPVLGRVPAGIPESLGENVETYITLPGAPPDCYALRVTGESMAPGIAHGDYALFVIDREAKPGDIVVVNDEFGDSMIKRLKEKDGDYYLVSDNPSYPTYQPNESYRIMGVVIGGWRQLKI